MSSRIIVRTGDLFKDSPTGSILLHACNCLGSWGGGIALAFRQNFPDAFKEYKQHCESHKDDPRSLLGTCLLIKDKEYDIGCLFTSAAFGRDVDSPDMILKATRGAVEDLMRQNIGKKPVHACQFNSGLFRVPWSDTQAVLEDLGVEMTVHVLPGQ